MVAYARLMAGDEAGTRAALHAHRRELIDLKIVEHRGRIVSTAGDSLLIEFESVVEAVQSTAEIQRGMALRNAEVPEDWRIVFRIGINIGDIIVEGDDIHGDGFNVAARLQTLADPGGICAAGVVFDQSKNKVDIGFQDLGLQSVKNIPEPVRAYRVLLEPEAVRTPEQ